MGNLQRNEEICKSRVPILKVEKMKILDSYYNMLRQIIDNNYKSKILDADKQYRFKNKVWNLPAGTCVYDCSDDEMSKILYMNYCVDEAYKGGAISLEQIRATVERAYNF